MKTFIKYHNRKLYSSEDKGYITTKELLNYVRNGACFKVIHYRTRLDVTADVLLQAVAQQPPPSVAALTAFIKTI